MLIEIFIAATFHFLNENVQLNGLFHLINSKTHINENEISKIILIPVIKFTTAKRLFIFFHIFCKNTRKHCSKTI